MKKEVLYIAIFGVLCALAGVLVGVGISKRPPFPAPYGRPDFSQKAERFIGYRQGPKGPFEMLAIRLNLDEAQKEKVRNILEESRREIETIGQRVRLSINEIRQKGDKKIMNILSPAQQQEFKILLKELEARHSENMRPHQPMHEMPPRDDNMPEK